MAVVYPRQISSSTSTTFVWDVAEIYSTDVNSLAFKELLVRLYQNLNQMQIALNDKDAGYYDNIQPFLNGQKYFPNPLYSSASPYTGGPSTVANKRAVSRFIINFGALPNATTKSVAHNLSINPTWTFTRIYGCANDNTNGSYIPIPYGSTTDAAHDVEIYVDNTYVNVKTGTNRSSYNTTYIVLEYLQN